MIYVTGDIHGSHSINKLGNKNFDSSHLTKEDIVIICGDFGLVWDYRGQNKDERYWLKWLEERPFTKRRRKAPRFIYGDIRRHSQFSFFAAI